MLKVLIACLASAAASTAFAAHADYFLKITGVAQPDGGGPIYLKVSSTGDLDGDGLPDDAVVKVRCDGGQLREAHYVVSPRDSATGMASGKRQHAPVTIVKEWGAATPQLGAMKPSYDLKKMEGARMSVDGGGWTALALSNADGLCDAAGSALNTIVKSKSNITNN